MILASSTVDINKHMNCFQMAMQLICKEFQKEIALIFADSWEFSYKKAEYFSSLGTSSFIEQPKNSLRFLGIMPIELNIHNGFCFDIIKEYVAFYKVLILNIESYYCHWHRGHGKTHIKHYCAVIGYTDQGLVCADPYLLGDKLVILPEENLKNCCSLSYYKADQKMTHLDIETLLKDIFSTKADKTTMFQMLKNFAEDLHNVNTPSALFDFPEDVYLCAITRSLKFIGDGRVQLGYLLEHLLQIQKCQDKDIIWIYKKLYQSGNTWQVVNNLITKLFYMPTQFSEIKEKIRKYLLTIIETEEEIFERMKVYFEKQILQ